MLRFFKTNAFYQIFSLIILILLVRLPLILFNIPLLNPELKWQLAGEQLAAGNLLYVDVLDNIGPFSGLIYSVIHYFMGRSTTSFHVIAFFITTIQIFYFTLLTHKKGLFKERNYVPGLILIMFYSLSFDFYTLSPALMGTTFLLFAFGSLLTQIEHFGATDEVFEIGVYLGIAFLFYPPLLIFFLWILFSLNLFTGAKLRQQFLVIFGMLFPIAIVGIWYFINGHFYEFYQYFLLQVFEKKQFDLNEFKGLLISYILPLAFSILGFFVVIGTSKYNNFQTRAQQIILLWFVAGVISIALLPFIAPMQFIPFVVPLAYFTILYFANIKKTWVAETVFLMLFMGVLFINYQAFVPRLSNVKLPKLEKLILVKVSSVTNIRNAKVLVMGNDLSPYMYNQTATPYINWALSKSDFVDIDNYENVINIIENFKKDPPNYIFDQENLLPKVFLRIPDLAKQYEIYQKGIYKRKGV